MVKRVRREALKCHSKDIYLAPSLGQSIGGRSFDVSWKPDCIKSSKLDIYLFSRHDPITLPLHAWLGLNTEEGSKSLPLDSSWWNGTSNLVANLQFVPSGSQPWETSIPLGPTWYLKGDNNNKSGRLDASSAWSNGKVTDYNDKNSDLSNGALAAAVILPILALLGLIVAAFMWNRHKIAKREEARRTRSMKQLSPNGASLPEAPAPMYGQEPYSSIGTYHVDVPDGYLEESDVKDLHNQDYSYGQVMLPSMETDNTQFEHVQSQPIDSLQHKDGDLNVSSNTKDQRRRSRKHPNEKRKSSKRRTRSSRQHYSIGSSLLHQANSGSLPESRVQAELQRRTREFRPHSRYGMLERPYSSPDDADSMSDLDQLSYGPNHDKATPVAATSSQGPGTRLGASKKSATLDPAPQEPDILHERNKFDGVNQRVLRYLQSLGTDDQETNDDSFANARSGSTQKHQLSTQRNVFYDTDDSLG